MRHRVEYRTPDEIAVELASYPGGSREFATVLNHDEARDLRDDLTAHLDSTCEKCGQPAEPDTSHGLCPDCHEARTWGSLVADHAHLDLTPAAAAREALNRAVRRD